jgi:hypothetical protein
MKESSFSKFNKGDMATFDAMPFGIVWNRSELFGSEDSQPGGGSPRHIAGMPWPIACWMSQFVCL